MNITFQKPIIQKPEIASWTEKGIQVSVLREDLIHPFISGNKWFKLKYNLEYFRKSGKKFVLTFGGAFSNHLVAVAVASKILGFNSIGIIRGEKVNNDYVSFMESSGMKLHFITREEYRNKENQDQQEKILATIREKGLIDDIENVFIIPEGGANEAAVRGAGEIMNDVEEDSDYIVCACGTGATIAGISKKLNPKQQALGISVLKADGYMKIQAEKFGGNTSRIIINDDYHFGGYAKSNPGLLTFCDQFSSQTGIPIEPVYTGKLFYGVDDLIRKNYFKKGSKVTVIHTGGIFDFKRQDSRAKNQEPGMNAN